MCVNWWFDWIGLDWIGCECSARCIRKITHETDLEFFQIKVNEYVRKTSRETPQREWIVGKNQRANPYSQIHTATSTIKIQIYSWIGFVCRFKMLIMIWSVEQHKKKTTQNVLSKKYLIFQSSSIRCSPKTSNYESKMKNHQSIAEQSFRLLFLLSNSQNTTEYNRTQMNEKIQIQIQIHCIPTMEIEN